jgi:hypothetical protein
VSARTYAQVQPRERGPAPSPKSPKAGPFGAREVADPVSGLELPESTRSSSTPTLRNGEKGTTLIEREREREKEKIMFLPEPSRNTVKVKKKKLKKLLESLQSPLTNNASPALPALLAAANALPDSPLRAKTLAFSNVVTKAERGGVTWPLEAPLRELLRLPEFSSDNDSALKLVYAVQPQSEKAVADPELVADPNHVLWVLLAERLVFVLSSHGQVSARVLAACAHLLSLACARPAVAALLCNRHTLVHLTGLLCHALLTSPAPTLLAELLASFVLVLRGSGGLASKHG